jgi:hypothetical protein
MISDLPATQNEPPSVVSTHQSFALDTGIDLQALQRLRAHPILSSTTHLTSEQFAARSQEFVPEEKRKDARTFVADVLLVKDREEQNAHLYKYMLKQFNPDATAETSRWERFNKKANAIAQQVRTTPRPDSARHLDDGQYEKRTRDFIDGRHQEEALSVTIPSRALETDPVKKPLYLPIHYDSTVTPTGRFEPTAWNYYNRARNVVDCWIESAKPIDPVVVLSVNSLLQDGILSGSNLSSSDYQQFGTVPDALIEYLENGQPPKGLTQAVRDKYAVMGVFRSTADLLRVIDEDGRYKSDFFNDERAKPQMLGFCTRRVFVKDVVPLLRELNEERPEPTRYQELYEAVQQVTDRGPQRLAALQQQKLARILHQRHGGDKEAMIADFKNPQRDPEYKRLQLLSSINPNELRMHLNQSLVAYRDEISRIQECYGGVEKLSSVEQQKSYQRDIVRLAVELGSVIDMGHFGMDGMGRTNLELERLVMGQCGLLRPGGLNVSHEGTHYENGTYVPKNVRIDAILAKLEPLDVDEAVERLGRLASSIRSNPVAKFKVS